MCFSFLYSQPMAFDPWWKNGSQRCHAMTHTLADRTHQKKCLDRGSITGPLDLQSSALPTELSRLLHAHTCTSVHRKNSTTDNNSSTTNPAAEHEQYWEQRGWPVIKTTSPSKLWRTRRCFSDFTLENDIGQWHLIGGEKQEANGGNWTHDLSLTKRVLYH